MPEQVASLVHQTIIDEEFLPGQQLPQQKELAQRFGVSLSVMRESLALLTSAGLVESAQGRGTFVRDVPRSLLRFPVWVGAASGWREVLESTEARYFVERAIARLASQRRTDPDLTTMTSHLEEMERHTSDPEKFAEADVSFHLALGSAARNQILEGSLQGIRSIIGQDVFDHHRHAEDEVNILEVLSAHRHVLEAVSRQDADAAEEAMGSIVQRAVDFVTARYAHESAEGSGDGEYPLVPFVTSEP